jgi:hypothetical protein
MRCAELVVSGEGAWERRSLMRIMSVRRVGGQVTEG